MDNRADINAIMRNSKGQLMTPLDAALYRGNRGCAKYIQVLPYLTRSQGVARLDFRIVSMQIDIQWNGLWLAIHIQIQILDLPSKFFYHYRVELSDWHYDWIWIGMEIRKKTIEQHPVYSKFHQHFFNKALTDFLLSNACTNFKYPKALHIYYIWNVIVNGNPK